MTNTMPIIRKQDTMVKAINIMSMYSKSTTGIRWDRAYSLSKAIVMIGFRKQEKKALSKTDNPTKIQMSVVVIVKMLPNRNAERSGVDPGARKLKMIPTAMPNVQNTAMAESSRISLCLLSHSTPNAESTEKMAADKRGEKPV